MDFCTVRDLVLLMLKLNRECNLIKKRYMGAIGSALSYAQST